MIIEITIEKASSVFILPTLAVIWNKDKKDAEVILAFLNYSFIIKASKK